MSLYFFGTILYLVHKISAQSFQLPNQLSEDGRFNFTQLAVKYGHPAEQYHVTTEDGYILTLFRLPGNKSQPVFLQHGLFASCDDFITRGNTSLSIILAKEGYDVWLGNTRGSRYSRRHVFLNPDEDPKFFDYSFDEFGYYDTPAFIDFILNETGQKQLSAMGHSEGNTIFYVLGSRRPEYNKKIKVFIALAPICFLNHIQPPLSILIKISPIINALFSAANIVEIIPPNSLLRQIIVAICSQPNIGYALCINVFMFPIVGFDPAQFEPEFTSTFIGHYPIESSLKNLYHYAQISLRRKFARYDYGFAKNVREYGTITPPEFDLSKVNMNVVLVAGKNDKFAPLADVETLNEKLPNVVEYHVLEQPRFNHIDFIYGLDSYKVLYPRLVEVLGKYN